VPIVQIEVVVTMATYRIHWYNENVVWSQVNEDSFARLYEQDSFARMKECLSVNRALPALTAKTEMRSVRTKEI